MILYIKPSHFAAVIYCETKDNHQDKKEARADGKITAAEIKIVIKDEKRANRSIYRKNIMPATVTELFWSWLV